MRMRRKPWARQELLEAELIELNHITERTFVISTRQQEVVCA